MLPALLAGLLLVVAQVVFATPPNASFLASVDPGTPATGCKTVTFTDTSTDAENDIATIQWDFGDGATDSGSSVTHTFAAAGDHTVTMTATDADTAGDGVETGTAQQVVNIPNSAPTATIGVSANPQAGQNITFTANPTDDGTIASYAWDFGDGLGTGNPATHAYADHVAHTVGLTVTDNCGVPGVAPTVQVTPGNTVPAVPAAPTAAIGGVAATVANPGAPVAFAVGATDANNDALTYAWDLDGDGAFDDSTSATPTFTYPTFENAHTANVRVRVTDAAGGVTTSPTFQLVVNHAPVAEFSNDPESPAVGEPVTFNGSASHDFESPGTALTYAWDLTGTGTYVAGTATPPAHAYSTVGDVIVHLRVTDPDGGVTITPKTIKVQKTRPTARLRVSPANPVPGQTITLTSTSSPSATPAAPAITLTQWDFNYPPTGAFTVDRSGTTATTSFSTAGFHTVAVRVTDGSGGTDIANTTIVVNARPHASFTVRPTKPVEGDEITFASTSSDPDGPISKQEWDLDGDNGYDDATGPVASTTKLRKGTHPVRLRVTDSQGATATITQQINVGAKPPSDAPDVTKTLGYARRSWGIQVVALYVSVPARTTVKVTCKGRGCPHGTFVKRSKKKSTQLRFTNFRGLLKAGAKITVVSSRNGSIAEYFTYTVRGDHRAPLKRKRCRAPGAKNYGSCG